MRVVLARPKDTQLLEQIKDTLVGHWAQTRASTQQRCYWFDKSIGNNMEEVRYAALLDQHGHILLVASLFKEYKFTRGLSEIYHLEVQHRACSPEQEQFFQEQVVKLIPGYKITGLGVKPGKVFEPHQVYMEMNMKRPSALQGKL